MSSGKLIGPGVLSSSRAISSIGLDHGGIMSLGAERMRREERRSCRISIQLNTIHRTMTWMILNLCRGSILECEQANSRGWTGTYKSFAVSIGGLLPVYRECSAQESCRYTITGQGKDVGGNVG